MAKLTDYKNPISGEKGNIFDLAGLWQMILGVFVLFLVFATGQKVANTVSTKVPQIDTRIEKPYADAPVQNNKTKIVL